MAAPTHGARSMKSKAFGFGVAAAFAVQSGACTGQLDIGRVADDGGAASHDGGGQGAGAASSGSSSGSGDGSPGVSSGSSGGASGSSSGSGSGTSSGSPGSSSGSGPTDASFEFDAPPAPAGLAGFAFVVNGVVQTPRTCAAESWEYPPPTGPTGQPIPVPDSGLPGVDTVCNSGEPPCPGLTVFLVNTGQFPVAYTAQPVWSGWNPPGVPFGNMGELSGVMSPGGSVDITSAYVGGIVAVLGSAQPFVDPDAGKYAADGTTVPWPAGVAGSGGATQMYVAQIEIEDSCRDPAVYWP
jgi:hypothetical protein